MPSGPVRSSDTTHSLSGTPATSLPGTIFCDASTSGSPVPTYTESFTV